MPSRKQIVDTAREWIGVPWRHQGRSKNGVDCAGLVIKVAHELGISDFDIANYRRNTRGHDFIKHFRDNMDPVPLQELEEGMVILFRDSMFPCHSALLTKKHGEWHIIHGYAPRKQVIEEPLDENWRKKWIAGFRYKGVTE